MIGIIFLVLIILAILVAIFGSEKDVQTSSFVLPFDTDKFTITSPYGERSDPINGTTAIHNGMDIVPVGTTNIVATADGEVVASGLDNAGAEYVMIQHNINGTLYKSGYWHLKENSRTVNVGDQVKQGQQIGIMGNTGRSTGAHLHFLLQKYNAEKQIFEYTSPSMIIDSKTTSKVYYLYDYDKKNFVNQKENQIKNKYDSSSFDKDSKYNVPEFNK